MKENFGRLPSGEQASLYTISRGSLTAKITDYGAALVSLLVPDRNGSLADVVLGYDDANGYRTANGAFLGAVVGRSANRIAGAAFPLNGTEIKLTPNEGANNLHSGPESPGRPGLPRQGRHPGHLHAGPSRCAAHRLRCCLQ